jgi:hypothetical protein
VLEEHNEKGRTRELYQQIREITGKPKKKTGYALCTGTCK